MAYSAAPSIILVPLGTPVIGRTAAVINPHRHAVCWDRMHVVPRPCHCASQPSACDREMRLPRFPAYCREADVCDSTTHHD